MNKLIKTCIIGGIVYMMCDASFQMGKGHILGVLAKADISASQCIDVISDDKRLRAKLIRMVAKIKKEES